MDRGAIWTPGPGARTIRAEAGLKLAHFLVQLQQGKMSNRAIRRALEESCCRINGRVETFGSRELVYGDVVEFFAPEDHEHHFDRARILFEDEHMLAYDKPAWLAVTPTDGPKSWSLHDILKQEFPLVIAVHRLDADTSGIVLFAKNTAAARSLEDQFRDHLVQKTYIALVRGHPRATGTHRSYLVKTDSGRGFERWASGRGPEAREAVTTWEVEATVGPFAARVRVEPKTGRHHQIRLHFSEIGHPIYGDRIYGDRQDPIQVGRHLLHAARAQLKHPFTDAPLDLKARLPREFTTAEQQLEKL